MARQGDGSWRLGCAFANELSPDELQAFQIEKVRPEAARPQGVGAVFVQCRDLLPGGGASPKQGVAGRVLEVSPGGMNLLAPVELERGTILNVKLPDGKVMVPRFVLVRVLRVEEFSSDRWFLACEFADQITAEDLQRFQ